MTDVQTSIIILSTLLVAAAVALTACYLFLPLRPQPPTAAAAALAAQEHPKPHVHDWTIASREERAGRARVVYRCTECGALEGRELP